MTAAPSMATGMYLPGLPQLAVSLGTSSSLVQLSLSTFLAGMAVGQLLAGPISDVLGRRRVLLAGSGSLAFFSALCAAAPGIDVLIAARFGEGVAGGCGVVVSRAVVAEQCHPRFAPRSYAVLAGAMAAAPLVAPLLGQAILSLASWRGVFVTAALIGVCQLAGVLVSVREPTGVPVVRQRGRHMGRVVLQVLADRVLVGYVLSLSLSGTAVFAYFAGTTFLLQGSFGLSAASTSVVYGVNAAGSLAGTVLYGGLAAHIGHRAITVATSGLMLGAVTALSVLLTLGIHSLATTWGCLFVFVVAFGVFFPAVTTAGQARGQSAPGVTSSLLSGQLLLGAVVTSLAASFGNEDGRPMAVVMALCSAAATVALVVFRERDANATRPATP